ncbi:hypothetical protein HYY75_01740, partial [bacterium]|nr:hypothetical protein [bacterium]
MNQKLPPLGFRSAYSFGYGVSLPDQMAIALREAGHKVLPITDIMGFWCLVSAIKSAKSNGLNLLGGVEVPLENGRLLLYPDDEMGYSSLCRLISQFHENFLTFQNSGVKTGEPFNWPCPPMLLKRLDGRGRVIAIGNGGLNTLACFAGKAWSLHWGIPESISKSQADSQFKIAQSLKAQPVALVELLASRKRDSILFRIIKAIHGNSLVSRVAQINLNPPKKPEELAGKFGWFPEAINGAILFAEKPTWIPPLGQ